MTAIQTVVAGILDMVSTILQTVGNFLVKIRETIASFSLFDVGVGLIRGLMDGVGSMVDDLIDQVYGAIESAIDAAKRLLGIESPSKVFAEIGRQVMEGLILGIDARAAKARRR